MKEDWMESKTMICLKCSKYKKCLIACGCQDWKAWYRHNNENKMRQMREEVEEERGVIV